MRKTMSYLLILSFSGAVALTGCGGGGGDGGSPSSSSSSSSSSSGGGSAANCTPLDQRKFVRNHIDDKYLFYKSAGTTQPDQYTGSAQQYFLDITRNTIPTVDRFSFVLTSAQANATFQEGTETGLGVLARYDASNAVRLTFVEPASPAARAGLQRGDKLIAINGAAIAATGVTATQNAALFTTTAGEAVTLDYVRSPDTTVRRTTLSAASYTTAPVPLVKTLTANAKKVGYLVFNDHNLPSETQLADAFKLLSQAGSTELVLDLRYNGGGYTAIASQVAYMIAGAQTTNKVFEYVLHNDKHSAEDYYEPFYNTIGLGPTRRGEALPSLNLSKVYVLTSAQTCSASELIINGLRGIDVQVVTIGGTTCGKPYAMQQADNCGYSYFALQSETANAKAVGRYTSGLGATCAAIDDVDHALGDPNEKMLSTALAYQASGQCAIVAKAESAGLGNLAGISLGSRPQSAILKPLR